ncbi:hypothetical protein AHAS_Ahas10G0058800 [Arachis hypogaea]
MSAELPWSTRVLWRWAFARIIVITTGSLCPWIIPCPSSFVNEIVGRSVEGGSPGRQLMSLNLAFSSILMYFSALSCTSLRETGCLLDMNCEKGPSLSPLTSPIMTASVGRLVKIPRPPVLFPGGSVHAIEPLHRCFRQSGWKGLASRSVGSIIQRSISGLLKFLGTLALIMSSLKGSSPPNGGSSCWSRELRFLRKDSSSKSFLSNSFRRSISSFRYFSVSFCCSRSCSNCSRRLWTNPISSVTWDGPPFSDSRSSEEFAFGFFTPEILLFGICFHMAFFLGSVRHQGMISRVPGNGANVTVGWPNRPRRVNSELVYTLEPPSDLYKWDVIPLWKEIEYYKEYQRKLRAHLGEEKANEILKEALYLVSIGTNDFLENYYTLPQHRCQFREVQQYENFLIGLAENFFKEIYHLGARKISLTGLPPMGCLPLERAINIMEFHGCVEEYNNVALEFNGKLRWLVSKLNKDLPGLQLVDANAYDILLQIVTQPSRFEIQVQSTSRLLDNSNSFQVLRLRKWDVVEQGDLR